jgi:hypothetical protein
LRHSDDDYLTLESQPEYPGIWRVYHQVAHFGGGTGVFFGGTGGNWGEGMIPKGHFDTPKNGVPAPFFGTQ